MDEKTVALEMLKAAKDSAQWAFWGAVGSWWAGIATFLAVLASLYIALRKPRAFVLGNVRLQMVINDDDHLWAIRVRVVNQSLHSVVVSNVIWEFGNDKSLQQLFRNDESDKLPIRIEHGDEANYMILLLGTDNDWIHRFARTLKNEGLSVKSLSCVITLSTGQRHRLKIKKNVKDRISEVMNKLN